MPSLDSITPDDNQRDILGWTAERNMVVTGVAGSGKSMILLKKAKQVSIHTQSYAIIVYTKSLKEFFVDELREIDPSGSHVFYKWEWFNTNHQNHYDYLFIDECQDFGLDAINSFRSSGTYCWFFGDTDQTIMSFNDNPTQSTDATASQLGLHPQNLAINYRLTIENAKVGESIFPHTHLSEACIKHGPKPMAIKCDSQEKELDRILKFIEDGDLTDVGILAFYNNQVRKIKNYFEAKCKQVLWKTKDNMQLDFKSELPKVVTFHCAKGLQFQNVFIPFNDDRRQDEIRAFYVATTRPLERLFITYVNDADFINTDSSIFASQPSVVQPSRPAPARNRNWISIDNDDLPF